MVARHKASWRASRAESDLILEGPNCLGMVNYVDGIPLTFVVTPPQARTDRPGAAILSQSGALAAVIAVNMRHHAIPLTYSVSTGNEAASSIEDFLEHLLTTAIRAYLLWSWNNSATEAVSGTRSQRPVRRQVHCAPASGPEHRGARISGHSHGRYRRRL